MGGIKLSVDPGISQLNPGSFINVVTTGGYHGYILLKEIEKESIKIEYAIYRDEKNVGWYGEHELKMFNELDLDEDGFVDLTLKPGSAYTKSKPLPKWNVLMFPYDDIAKKGARFSAKIKKIQGLVGFSTKNHAIYNSMSYKLHESPSESSLSFDKTPDLPQFFPGDLIIDVHSFLEKKGPVLRKITDVEDHGSYVTLKTEKGDPAEIYRGLKVRLKGIKLSDMEPIGVEGRGINVEYSWSGRLIDLSNVSLDIDATGYLDMVMDVELDVDIFSVDLERFYLRSYFDHGTTLGYILSVYASFSDEGKTPDIVLAAYGFDVFGIPIAIQYVLYFGYEIDAMAQITLESGVDYSLGFEVVLEADAIDSWDVDADRWGHVTLMPPTLTVEGNINVRPYMALDQELTIGGIFEGGFGIKPDVEITASGEANSRGDVHTELDIVPGLNIHVKAGVDLGIDSYRGDWDVLQWDITRYTLEWGYPTYPRNLNAYFREDGVHLSWLDVSEIEHGYEIWKKPGILGTWMKIGEAGPDVEEFVDTSAEADILYIYKVNAYFDSYSGRTRSDPATVSILNNSPSEPTPVYPSDGQNLVPINLTLRWSCSDPDGDTLRYDLYLGESSPPALLVTDLTNSEYTVSGLPHDTVYYWKVVADDGKKGIKESPIWTFRTVPPGYYNLTVESTPVEGLTVTVDSTSGVTPFTLGLDEGTHTVEIDSPQYEDISTFVSGNDAKYVFEHWTDSSIDNPREVYIASDLTLTAIVDVFYRVVVVASPSDAGTVLISETSTDGYYPEGVELEFTAKPYSGYTFDHWILNGEHIGGNPLDWSVNYPIELVAVFR